MKRKHKIQAPPKRGPVKSTGGSGYDFEDLVAARFMLDMLGASPSLGSADFGHAIRIDWQARDMGWLTDDLVVTMATPKGIRIAGVSAKSGQSVTRAGFPSEFVTTVWQQWLQDNPSLLRGTSNVVVLVTGKGNRDLRSAWNELVSQVKLAASSRMVERLTNNPKNGNQTSQFQRNTLSSFAPPAGEEQIAATQEETVALLSHIRWLDFDYQSSESADQFDALALCQKVLVPERASDAKDLWEALIETAKTRRHAGGTISQTDLASHLHPKFQIKVEPNYDVDWGRLAKRGEQERNDIRTTVSQDSHLLRADELRALEKDLTTNGVSLLVGDSGCGKSALVKNYAEGRYSEVIWLNAATLEFDSYPDFVRAVGLRNSMADLIRARTSPTLFVFDGFEGLSAKSQRLAKQILSMLKDRRTTTIHIVVTVQTDAASDAMRSLLECGISISAPTTVQRPSGEDIRQLVSNIPTIKWVGLRPETRSLLTNLKMLDWFTRSVPGAAPIGEVVGFTDLIDAIWRHFVENGDHKYEISHLLIEVATLEADNQTDGIPRTLLGHAEQGTLREVEGRDLVRVRDERVRFFHDLLGDWARLRSLLEPGWLTDRSKRERYTVSRWYRAVRLYGQYLLERSDNGIEHWQAALYSVSDGTPDGRAVADLFLDALYTAPDAQSLIEKAWPVLVTNDATFLRRLLKRFLYVATLPDIKLLAFADSPDDAESMATVFRIPLWAYWRSVVQVLHYHKDETVKLVPRLCAEICTLFLKHTQQTVAPGYFIPGRKEAAELALTLARDHQLREELGPYGRG